MPTVPPTYVIDAAAGYSGPMLNIEQPAGGVQFSVSNTGLVYTANALYGAAAVWSAGYVVGEQGLVVGAGGAATTQIMADGQVRAKTGTAGSPSYAFLADTTSGLRSGGSGVLRLVTGGGDKVTIDASGNVGIGITTPAEQLHATGNIRADGRLLVGDGTLGSPAVSFATSPGTGLSKSSDHDIRFTTNGQLRILIQDNNGRVTIGTGASSSARLTVAGDSRVISTSPFALLVDTGLGHGVQIDTSNKCLAPLSDNSYKLGTEFARWQSADVAGDVKAGNFVLNASGKLYLNGAGGTHYFVDNPTLQSTDLTGQLSVKDGFLVNDGFKSSPHPVNQNGLSVLGGAYSAPGLLQTNWNIQVLRNQDVQDSTNPPLMYIGLDLDNNLYTFFQYRDAAQGGIWGGTETYKNPPQPALPLWRPAAWGYGFQPIRYWGKNVLVEANGDVVALKNVTRKISFLRPKHIDVEATPVTYPNNPAPTYQYPDTLPYPNNRPMRAGKELGGIGYSSADENVSIYRSGALSEGPDLVFQDTYRTLTLSDLIQGILPRTKVVKGEAGSFTLQMDTQSADPLTLISMGTSFFSAASYSVALTVRNAGNAWAVTLAMNSPGTSSFGIIARNAYGAAATFYVQWIAIGT